jgi:hypothetical protein
VCLLRTLANIECGGVQKPPGAVLRRKEIAATVRDNPLISLSFRSPFMDEVSTVNFELTEAQYAANEVAESWVQRFLVAFMACLQFLSPIMAGGPYDAVVSNILDKVRDQEKGGIFGLRGHSYLRTWSAGVGRDAGKALVERESVRRSGSAPARGQIHS